MSTPAEFSLRRVVGLVLAGLGIYLIAYPFLSVRQLGDDVLSLLPEAASEVSDERPAAAIFDGDFVVARRTYERRANDTAAVDELRAALEADGFDPWYRSDDASWLIKECCGSYDAALARVGIDGNGLTTVEMSALDSDIRFTWWLLSGFGGLLAITGLFVARPSHVPGREQESVSA